MKLNHLLLFISTITFAFNTQAQSPVLDSTVCITVGHLAQINVINNALSIPSGNAGPNQTYDYSVLPAFNSSYEILGVDNLTSPYGTIYPAANATVSWSSFGTPYYHFLLSDTSYIYLGGGSSFGDYQYLDTYTQLKFPLTYNDVYTDTFVAVSNTGSYRAGNVTVSGDGYGNLLIPGQTFNDVLRVKRYSEYDDTISGNPRHTVETYYEYYKPGIPHYILLHGFYTITTGSSSPVSGSQLFLNSGAIVSNNSIDTAALLNYYVAKNENEWNIQTQSKSSYTTPLYIYNLQGQLLFYDALSISTEKSSKRLPKEQFSNGIYIICFKNFNGKPIRLKWCKTE
jgi:hypothetical protein